MWPGKWPGKWLAEATLKGRRWKKTPKSDGSSCQCLLLENKSLWCLCLDYLKPIKTQALLKLKELLFCKTIKFRAENRVNRFRGGGGSMMWPVLWEEKAVMSVRIKPKLWSQTVVISCNNGKTFGNGSQSGGESSTSYFVFSWPLPIHHLFFFFCFFWVPLLTVGHRTVCITLTLLHSGFLHYGWEQH